VKIQLKRFTTNARLSQETTAFAADVWVDGKKAGNAQNDGHGGATLVRQDPSVRDRVEAHGKALVPDALKGFTGGAEWIVDELVEAELQKRSDKKIARADAAEKTSCEKQGLHAARLRCGDEWLWFAFNTGADPKVIATAIAAKEHIAVDELVVL
jgi:hypothetical protein